MTFELRGTSGGRKQMWLKQHRDMVLDFCATFGREATMEQFSMKGDTLDSLIDSRRQEDLSFKIADRAIVKTEQTDVRVRELSREVGELKASYTRFTEVIGDELANKFFMPLFQLVIQLPEELRPKPATDGLLLSDINTKRLTSEPKSGD
jgi:hypothetical protein